MSTFKMPAAERSPETDDDPFDALSRKIKSTFLEIAADVFDPSDLETVGNAFAAFLEEQGAEIFGGMWRQGVAATAAANGAQPPQDPTDLDTFRDSGLIVVGAYALDAYGSRDKTRYSNSGPGLCVLAPSDADFLPAADCHDWKEIASRPVVTADLTGPGGYASDHSALLTSSKERIGFGGTSAASAQVGGALALLAEQLGPMSPSDLRRELVLRVRDLGYTLERGYGALHLGGS